MSRRERLEQRAERRRDWAESRDRKSAAGFAKADRIASGIPMGQPVLVGHHSERHHRADLARIDSGMAAGVESMKMASEHRSKADGIERQLETSIFSDDPDAVEALEAKAAAIDSEADRRKNINAVYRKARGVDQAEKLTELVCAGTIDHAEARSIAKLFGMCPWEKQPYPAYSITNLRATARRCRERIKAIAAQAEQSSKAEAAGGTLVEFVGEAKEYARVTFDDHPGNEMVQALKAAGFHWSRPSWYGKADALPAQLRDARAGRI